MRGKIIQYNGADGSGTLVADGKQYPFVLAAWRGNNAPAVNKTVEITFDGDAISAITAVGEEVLLKEKAAEFSGKLGASFNKLRASIPAATGTPAGVAATPGPVPLPGAAANGPASNNAITVNSIIERYGKLVLGAYVLFMLGTLVFNAISMSMYGQSIGKSMFDIASLMSQMGGSGGGMVKLLLLLGYASIAVPLFWRDRRAWLALTVPLLALVWAIFSTLHAIDSLGNGVGQAMSDAFSLGFGFYLSLAAAIVLTVLGVKRFLSAA